MELVAPPTPVLRLRPPLFPYLGEPLDAEAEGRPVASAGKVPGAPAVRTIAEQPGSPLGS
ncbi:hypothetical protein AQJ43_35950 [Streptomyces avermitilis]|uniref:Uncharacterized protein n=1 Tax=Streptomyces avermitilis TaxID=33903 RepID=A0A4D4MAV2_STRAX|nr:hypothetical protein AQJ43_35950 [Streptomyces avermitilis]OOV24828.1 hypothetical protein SM007_28805 [Streptomyces avermitilis]BBJ47459.1 hypothetical protein SAVMC3_00880 [Streptomyces avermitilis]GDY69016.1 hypothetical protein SAV14893_084090 [Streptomyces avermitilis]GDY70602.1 hypothetical protein SAV31267_000870 [Streptomyces avermitilis]